MFEMEPRLVKLIPKNNTSGSSNEFGLVLVAGWETPPNDLKECYESTLNKISNCFDKNDIQNSSSHHTDLYLPAVYLYPHQSLHVTIATLYPPTEEDSLSNDEKSHIIQFWNSILNQASRNNEWPKERLKLRISSAQIGEKAGIFLWDELTGGIKGMRSAISQELADYKNQMTHPFENNLVTNVRLPNIIHSTFMRFAKTPTSSWMDVQDKFQTHIIPSLKTTFFTKDFILSDATLVNEKKPFMHIPRDDQHIIKTFTFGL